MDEKKMAKSQKKSNKPIIIIIGVILLIVVAIGAWIMMDMRDPAVAQNEEVQQETTAPIEMMKIETPYGNLEYPSTHEKYLVLDENTDEDAYSQKFSTTLFGDEEELFTVYFNDSDKGEPVGYVKDGDNKIPVTIEVTQRELEDSTSEEDADIYYTMIDGVNSVLTSITELENYSEE